MDNLKNKTKKNFELVITRYNEDINWSDNYIDYRTVYNKGDINVSYEHIKRQNIGRDGESPLYHIINNYNNLADITFFCQGAINDRDDQIISLEHWKKYINFEENHLYGFCIRRDLPNKDENFLNCPITFGDIYYKIFGKKYEQNFEWVSGMWISVHKNIIKSVPLEIYKKMYNLFYEYKFENDPTHRILAVHIERFLYHVFSDFSVNNQISLNSQPNMLYIYTFCVFINRHSKNDLINVLNLFITSLDLEVKKYKLIVYTNFIENINNNNIELRQYYDNSEKNRYNNNWLNLSYNKINIYKDLYDEFKCDFLWIDIDTIITYDISYLNNIDNIFLEQGGNCSIKKPIFENSSENIESRKYIQGNIWKLNIDLYNDLMICINKLDKLNLVLRYDLQDLFNYYIYFYDNKKFKNINIYGNNCFKNTLNGLAQWNINEMKHPYLEGLEKMYFKNDILRTQENTLKEIHFVTFTFYTFNNLYNTNIFKNIFKKYIK